MFIRVHLWLLFLCVSAVNSRAMAQERQAQLSWWDRSAEAKVGHYWIKTDLPADQANSLARHLNIMHGEYAKRLAGLPVRAEERLNVLIFSDPRDYLLTLRARFGVNATGSGGMFFVTSAAPAGALAFWTGDLPRRRIEHVIQHEAFHQFAYSRFGDDLPVWVNEGLAEFFGEAVVVGESIISGQANARVIESIKNAIELNKHKPFRQMLTITSKQWGSALQDNSAPIMYHQAWSMVQFLIEGEQGRHVNAFEVYLKHLNNGLPSEETFSRAFGSDIEEFETRWKQYALAVKPSAFTTAIERIDFLAQGALELQKRAVEYPTTLDGLRDALGQIKFTHVINTHGVEAKLSASDDALFKIPLDDSADPERPPAFVLSKPRIIGMTRRERELEDSHPTPPVIGTENLKPRSVRIKWVRNPDNKTFHYQIVVEER